jgi:hypothetical protein
MGVPGLFSWLARHKYPEIVEALPDAVPDAPDGSEQRHADNLYIGALTCQARQRCCLSRAGACSMHLPHTALVRREDGHADGARLFAL